MTYNELMSVLQGLTEYELEQEVTVLDRGTGEYQPINAVGVATDRQEILDEGHFILSVGEGIDKINRYTTPAFEHIRAYRIDQLDKNYKKMKEVVMRGWKD